MQSMDQHLLQLIKEGRITSRAAYERAIDKKIFETMMGKE
jgi:twitching motility protein PilT